jgi:hypothetical protein
MRGKISQLVKNATPLLSVNCPSGPMWFNDCSKAELTRRMRSGAEVEILGFWNRVNRGVDRYEMK